MSNGVTGVKFSQITPAPNPPSLADYVCGVSSNNVDYRYTLAQINSIITGGGGGGGLTMPIAPSTSTTSEATHLFKPSAGSLYGSYVVNLSSVGGYFLLLD